MSFLKKLAKGVSNVVSKVSGIAAKIIPGPNPLLEGVSSITGKITQSLSAPSSNKVSPPAQVSNAAQAAQAATFATEKTVGASDEPKKSLSGGIIAAIVGGGVVLIGLVVWLFSRKKRK